MDNQFLGTELNLMPCSQAQECELLRNDFLTTAPFFALRATQDRSLESPSSFAEATADVSGEVGEVIDKVKRQL